MAEWGPKRGLEEFERPGAGGWGGVEGRNLRPGEWCGQEPREENVYIHGQCLAGLAGSGAGGQVRGGG